MIDDYSQRLLALPIPGSRLNARNSPGTRPYCDRQPLKKFHGSNEIIYAVAREPVVEI